MEGVKKGDKKMEEKTPQEQLDGIYARLEDGEISISEAMKQSNALSGEIATQKTVDMFDQQTREALFEQDVQAAEAQFHKDYPDYQEFVESGKAQEYMAKNPTFIDEVIAYFQWKGDQRFEEGKRSESENKTKEGGETDKQYLSRDEIESLQMERVLKMRDKRPARKGPFASEEELKTHQLETIRRMRGESS